MVKQNASPKTTEKLCKDSVSLKRKSLLIKHFALCPSITAVAVDNYSSILYVWVRDESESYISIGFYVNVVDEHVKLVSTVR